jgi:hypothetical protein
MRSFSTRAAGLLILVLGVWGALVPFVGPYFHFALGPTKSWTWTSGRLWLSVLPGIAAAIGGLMLISAGPRPTGKLGALLALAAGIWFAIGPDVSLLWNTSGAQGAAHGSVGIRALEAITYHTGLGVVIAALAAFALPGFLTRRTAVAQAGAGAGGAAVAEREAAAGPARRGVDEPAVAGETGVADREPAVAGETAVADREPAVAGETAVADREPAGVGATGVGDRTAGGRAEYAGTRSGGDYGNGGAVAEHDGEYGTEQGPSAPAAPAEVRRRRSGGLLSAFRR